MSELQKILNDILAEAEAATEEPWIPMPDGEGGFVLGYISAGQTKEGCSQDVIISENDHQGNIDFIAHSRTTVPRLCEALKEATQAMKHEGGTILNDAIARITAMLKGEDDG